MCCPARLPFESYRKSAIADAIKPMTKQTIAAIILCAGAAVSLTTPAQAGEITATIASYDSTNGYDYSSTFPPATYQNIGTFTFTPVVPEAILNITVSGSFGNGDSPTTALSDYYLGYSGDEEAVPLVQCDSYTADCNANEDGPTDWTVTLTPSNISTLASALAAGSIDFGYTWDQIPTAQPVDFFGSPTLQYVYAGEATLTIAPEPATVLFCFGGLAGLVAFRRFRKP
jgi:hypothetical protein